MINFLKVILSQFDVPKKIHEALMNAESHGSYLAKNIKGVHKHSKVERTKNDDRK